MCCYQIKHVDFVLQKCIVCKIKELICVCTLQRLTLCLWRLPHLSIRASLHPAAPTAPARSPQPAARLAHACQRISAPHPTVDLSASATATARTSWPASTKSAATRAPAPAVSTLSAESSCTRPTVFAFATTSAIPSLLATLARVSRLSCLSPPLLSLLTIRYTLY